MKQPLLDSTYSSTKYVPLSTSENRCEIFPKLVGVVVLSSKSHKPEVWFEELSIKLITGFVISAGWGYAEKLAIGNGLTITSTVPEMSLASHPLMSVTFVIE